MNPKCFSLLYDSLSTIQCFQYIKFCFTQATFLNFKTLTNHPGRDDLSDVQSFSASRFQFFFIWESKKGVWNRLRRRKKMGKALLIFYMYNFIYFMGFPIFIVNPIAAFNRISAARSRRSFITDIFYRRRLGIWVI